MAIRFRIAPGDISPAAAARRIGLTEEKFRTVLPKLLQRGFPASDETTGNFCLEAIDRWRFKRFPHLFQLTQAEEPSDDREAARARIARL
jgi:hypothetical protein